MLNHFLWGAVMKPIFFNTEMVKALLDGRKTVTRRLIKPALPSNIIRVDDVDPLEYMYFQTSDRILDGWNHRKCQYEPGLILYVRESWAIPYGCEYRYRADYKEHDIVEADRGDVSSSANLIRWHPSIHMPREAARIFLRVTNVSAERLQDITTEGLVKDFNLCLDAVDAVGKDILAREVWNKTINKKDRDLYGWDANPWVWVIAFERISKEEAMKEDKNG